MDDRVTLKEEGPWRWMAYTVPDPDTRPDDFDCYDVEQVHAWEHDDWRFVGLIVEVQFDGVTFGDASLWAVEEGYLPTADGDKWVDPTKDRDLLQDLEHEAWVEAQDFARRVAVVTSGDTTTEDAS